MGLLRRTAITMEMIKWEHSVFALPFALTATVLAAKGIPSGHVLAWILVCMVAARSAAMAFNRLADATLDAANPRTAARAIPAGNLSVRFAGGFVIFACACFLIGAWQLNRMTLALAPVALAVVLGYSYTKRFTRWSHLVLGLALGIAPAGAWIAVRGSLDLRILLLAGAVLCWVAGFDVLYACQDYEHDCGAGLNSIPVAFGIGGAFVASRSLHVLALALLCWMVPAFGLGKLAAAGVVLVAALLWYEHSLVSPANLTRLNAAFFTTNGVIAIVYFLFTAADVLRSRL